MRLGLIFLLGYLFVHPVYANSLIDQIDTSIKYRTDILAIYKKGDLIYEEFRQGYQRDQKHKLWSLSKSISSLLVARAVKESVLNVEDSICLYVNVSDLSSPAMCEITIDRLLFWQSGVEWAEMYVGLDGSQSSVLNGLYGEGIYDFQKYYFSQSYLNSVQYNWNYSTGDSHILSYILQRAYPPMHYDNLPWDKLFDPLGIKDATYERDHTGVYLGGSYIYLSHPSLNKIAQFILDEIETPKDLPDNWFDYVLTAKAEVEFSDEVQENQPAAAIPGGQWWLNHPTNPDLQKVPWPKAPADVFAAFGVFGQVMFIVPSQELVVIRLAQDIIGGFDDENLLNVALKYAEDL